MPSVYLLPYNARVILLLGIVGALAYLGIGAYCAAGLRDLEAPRLVLSLLRGAVVLGWLPIFLADYADSGLRRLTGRLRKKDKLK